MRTLGRTCSDPLATAASVACQPLRKAVALTLMALELEYRGTFIDVQEDPFEVSGSIVRSASAPAMYVRTLECAAEVEERQLKGYVENLPQSMAELSEEINQKGTKSHAAEPTAAEEVQPVQLEVMPGSESQGDPSPLPHVPSFRCLSEGSVGHPEVCRRPCVYFNRGFCQSGAACTYCHCQHTDRDPKPDKKQRTTLDEITQAQLLTLVLRFLRQRAEATGMADKATGVLAILEQELRFWQGESEVVEAAMDNKARKLGKVMARMSFGALLSLASHRLDREEFQHLLSQEMEVLRQSV